jgi:hypothetical protein
MARRIQIKGVRRREIDADLMAYVYFTQAKRLVQQRREREAEEKKKHHGLKGQKDGRSGDRS